MPWPARTIAISPRRFAAIPICTVHRLLDRLIKRQLVRDQTATRFRQRR